MQLNKQKSIRQSLSMATSTLLGLSAISHTNDLQAAEKNLQAEVNASSLYYTEKDRVTVNKFQARNRKEIKDETFFTLGFIHDAMTGASPNGRYVPDDANAADTTTVPITTASGFSFTTSTSTSTLDKPWYSAFEDERWAFSSEFESKLTRNLGYAANINYSTENDYTSKGIAGTFNWDVNQKLTTISIGGALNFDTVRPEAGIPESGKVLQCDSNTAVRPTIFGLDCDATAARLAPAEKVVNTGFIGFTQVLSRESLLQLNYSYGLYDGYLTDPYKQVSLFHTDTNNVATETGVLYEKRPDTRQTNSIYIKLVKLTRSEEVVHASYRFFWDDWGITANTLDGRLRFDFDNAVYGVLHARISAQKAADFHRDRLNDAVDTEMPEYVTADHRLGRQTTFTVGAKVGYQIEKYLNMGIRAENIMQAYKTNNLPTMRAWVLQFLMTLKL
jgi:hypothetical protein